MACALIGTIIGCQNNGFSCSTNEKSFSQVAGLISPCLGFAADVVIGVALVILGGVALGLALANVTPWFPMVVAIGMIAGGGGYAIIASIFASCVGVSQLCCHTLSQTDPNNWLT